LICFSRKWNNLSASLPGLRQFQAEHLMNANAILSFSSALQRSASFRSSVPSFVC
jgi:hypothetical protein